MCPYLLDSFKPVGFVTPFSLKKRPCIQNREKYPFRKSDDGFLFFFFFTWRSFFPIVQGGVKNRVNKPFVNGFIIFNAAFMKSLPLLFTTSSFHLFTKADAYLSWPEVMFASCIVYNRLRKRMKFNYRAGI